MLFYKKKQRRKTLAEKGQKKRIVGGCKNIILYSLYKLFPCCIILTYEAERPESGFFKEIIMKKIGRQVLFIETSKGNPRNGEGAFMRLKNGSIMFGYTEFLGDSESWDDDANARISVVFSEDEGETWSESQVLFEKSENSKNIMCLSFLRMNNDDIGAFYIVKNADGTDKIVLTRSADEGKTWSEPLSCMECLEEQDYYVLNNDRVLKLKSGRIIFAVARHTVHSGEDVFMPGELCFFISDDDGATWQKTQTELKCPFEKDPDGYEEPGLYELSDGRIWCYIRTGLGWQFEAFSSDEGITWSTPSPNMFFSSPCSPMLVKDCGKVTVAVFNPIPEHIMRDDEHLWGRTPYVLAVSTDRGETFKKEKIFYLENDPKNGYCYPAILQGEDYFLVAYYHSNNSGVCLDSTKIVKIMYDEII